MARGDQFQSATSCRLCAWCMRGTTFLRVVAILAMAALILFLTLPATQVAAAQEVTWVLKQTLVNPDDVALEYYGGPDAPGFFDEERFNGMFLIYEPSATSFTFRHRWQDREYVGWDMALTCDFDSPPALLEPGSSYDLSAHFSHSGMSNEASPGARFSYGSLDAGINSGDALAYYPWAPTFEGVTGKTWTFTAPAASAGATLEISAGIWNAPPCTVIWKYEATTAAPEYGVIEVGDVIHLVSPPDGVLQIGQTDLPEWARDVIATVGDEVACTGPPAKLTEGDSTVLLDGRPVVRLGDGTSHGGTVVSANSRILVNGIPAATYGDFAACPMVTYPVPHVGGYIMRGAKATTTTMSPTTTSTPPTTSTLATSQSTAGTRTFTDEEFEKMLADTAAFAETYTSSAADKELLKDGYIGLLIEYGGDFSLYDRTGSELPWRAEGQGGISGRWQGRVEPIRIGDTIRTGSTGSGFVVMFTRYRSDEYIVEIRRNTEVVFTNIGTTDQETSYTTMLEMLKGAIRALGVGPEAWTQNSIFSVRAGTTLCGMRGTDVFIHYAPEEDVVAAWVREGVVDVTSSTTGWIKVLVDGEGLVVESGDLGDVRPLTEDRWDDMNVDSKLDGMKPPTIIAIDKSDGSGGRPMVIVEFSQDSNTSLILAVVIPVVVVVIAASIGTYMLRLRRKRADRGTSPPGGTAAET